MSRLTRDGTAEPVSRDQFLRREQGQGKIQLTTSRIGNLARLIHALAIMCVTIQEDRLCDTLQAMSLSNDDVTRILLNYTYLYSSIIR